MKMINNKYVTIRTSTATF